eukprot:scaffold541_cov138-Cylindrotheca_fusiformis.AAC.10
MDSSASSFAEVLLAGRLLLVDHRPSLKGRGGEERSASAEHPLQARETASNGRLLAYLEHFRYTLY